jgi:hypothetical protein
MCIVCDVVNEIALDVSLDSIYGVQINTCVGTASLYLAFHSTQFTQHEQQHQGAGIIARATGGRRFSSGRSRHLLVPGGYTLRLPIPPLIP